MGPIMTEPAAISYGDVFRQTCATVLFRWNITNYSPSEMKSNGAVLFEPPHDGMAQYYEEFLVSGGFRTLRTPRLEHFFYAIKALAPRLIVFDPYFIPE